MSLRDDLIAAKALIDTPEKWMKDDYESDGCYCALGAARKAFFGTVYGHSPVADHYADDNPVTFALIAALPSGRWGDSVHLFNDADRTTHADIMALFDRAIAAAPSIDMSKQGANPRDNHEETSK